jgi:3',5'-cyclic AMP phosphodiesterase CpdA
VLPEGDVLIHAGDFTMRGRPKAIRKFNAWLGRQPHKHKIVIAGNHDITFDDAFYDKDWERYEHSGFAVSCC